MAIPACTSLVKYVNPNVKKDCLEKTGNVCAYSLRIIASREIKISGSKVIESKFPTSARIFHVALMILFAPIAIPMSLVGIICKKLSSSHKQCIKAHKELLKQQPVNTPTKQVFIEPKDVRKPPVIAQVETPPATIRQLDTDFWDIRGQPEKVRAFVQALPKDVLEKWESQDVRRAAYTSLPIVPKCLKMGDVADFMKSNPGEQAVKTLAEYAISQFWSSPLISEESRKEYFPQIFEMTLHASLEQIPQIVSGVGTNRHKLRQMIRAISIAKEQPIEKLQTFFKAVPKDALMSILALQAKPEKEFISWGWDAMNEINRMGLDFLIANSDKIPPSPEFAAFIEKCKETREYGKYLDANIPERLRPME